LGAPLPTGNPSCRMQGLVFIRKRSYNLEANQEKVKRQT
jgi:hypothetical protein